MFSIVGVNATRKFPVHLRSLVFIDGHPDVSQIPASAIRAIRDFEMDALRYPALNTQRGDGAFESLDIVNQNGRVAMTMIGEQNQRTSLWKRRDVLAAKHQ